MSKFEYLIIAGANKAGTTSLFDYLSMHPQIDESYIKQTFFFLDREWQEKLNLKAIYDYRSGFEMFNNYYRNNACKLKLEASPEYLYAPETPKRLHDFFKNNKGKIIFILREPTSRFNSLFYFGKQQGLIPESMSYSRFYDISLNYKEDSNPCLMAHKTGYYFNYLKRYFDIFGKENIIVLFFENMKRNPQDFMLSLSAKLNIDNSFYKDFNFEIKNQTMRVKSHVVSSLYEVARAWYMKHLFKHQAGISFVQLLKKNFIPLYKKMNYMPLVKTSLDPAIIAKLRSDYSEEKHRLKLLLHEDIPW